MKKLLLWGGLGLLLLFLTIGLIRSQKGGVKVGDVAPDFQLTSFAGDSYNLSDYSGKVVVLNFWASWCETCKPEAEDLEAASQYYLSRGDVFFFGVDYVDTEPEALGYLEDYGVTYPNGPDLRTDISQAYRVTGVPETFIIDQNGFIAHVQIGPFRSLEDILLRIDPLLD